MKVSIPHTPQVSFEPGELSVIELVHAKATTHLIPISNRMKEKNITYREAFLELKNEGVL